MSATPMEQCSFDTGDVKVACTAVRLTTGATDASVMRDLRDLTRQYRARLPLRDSPTSSILPHPPSAQLLRRNILKPHSRQLVPWALLAMSAKENEASTAVRMWCRLPIIRDFLLISA